MDMLEKKAEGANLKKEGEAKPEAVAKKAEPAKKVESVKKKTEPMVYIGPPVFKVVMPGSVFLNGYTTVLQTAIEEAPAIGELMVPVSEVVRARAELRDSSTAVSICYRAVAEYNTKRGKKEEI